MIPLGIGPMTPLLKRSGNRCLNPQRYHRISVDFLFVPVSDEIQSVASDCVDTAISDPIR